MAIRTFRDLIMWQVARGLTLDIYNSFRSCKDYSFKDQIQRASVSTMNNIAEGYGRKSNKAFKNFLSISKGSAFEVESMLDLALGLTYITEEQFESLNNQVSRLNRVITAFINRIPTNY